MFTQMFEIVLAVCLKTYDYNDRLLWKIMNFMKRSLLKN